MINREIQISLGSYKSSHQMSSTRGSKKKGTRQSDSNLSNHIFYTPDKRIKFILSGNKSAFKIL